MINLYRVCQGTTCLFMGALLVFLPVFSLYAEPISAALEREPLYSCSIDLLAGTTTCDTYVQVSEQQNNQAKAQINMCSLIGSQKVAQAEFHVRMGSKPVGWLFNVGDSFSNNGWGGDWGDGLPEQPWQAGAESTGQSRDAEVQLNGNITGVNHSWSAWGNDHTTDAVDGHRRLFAEGNLSFAGKTVKVLVGNEQAEFSIPGSTSSVRRLQSPSLFGLAGQPDFQGPVDCDLHVGVNRIIDGLYRVGSGVEMVEIILYAATANAGDTPVYKVSSVLSNKKGNPVPGTTIPKSFALGLSPATNSRVAALLKQRGLTPDRLSTAMLGSSQRSLQMVVETLRAQGLLTTTEPVATSTVRKALRRFQKRIISSRPLTDPAIVADLLSAEAVGDIR